ncbi:MAG: substrate-binding domain-containing protein, partial [Oscillospiraceae bacterium]|nr:substrate-binding domain-containing protein [Oscillospiraceae bacterium]
MNTTRRLIALFLCVLLAAGALSGCGGPNNADNTASPNSADISGGTDSGDTGSALKIEVVSKGFQVDFWKMVNRGCHEAGAAYGASVNFVGPASEANISEQIEQFGNAINKAPDAICFAPLDQDASMDLIAQAGAAGIPLITFDANIEADTGGAVLAFVATDNV